MNPPLHRKLKGTHKNLGCCAKIIFHSGSVICCRNVTEIHYNYPSPATEILGPSVAFESDIHRNGCTFKIKDIASFETTLETAVQADF
jgi:hypothetical protein